MIRRFFVTLGMILFASLLALSWWPREFITNPDPSHTHADFAVWIDGEKMDFSDEKYMSSSEKHLHAYLHLHDSLGHVIHRHQAGFSLHDFFDSLGVHLEEEEGLRKFMNRKEVPFNLDYVSKDVDRILITDSTYDGEIEFQLGQLTRDACLYSRTCPWRGNPPEENCIADPNVPCIAPPDLGFGL